MLYLPIGVITVRFCTVLDSIFFLFLHSTLFCLDSTIWLDSTLKLCYATVQIEVKLSGFLSKYAEHVVWCRTVLRLRVSASDGTNPTPCPDSVQ